MRRSRLILGLALLLIFAAGYFSAAAIIGPLHDILVGLQLAPALLRLLVLSGGAAAGAGVALVMITAGTLLFGRFYCALLCPTGLLQDLFLLFRKRGFSRQPSRRLLHGTVLLLTAGSAAAGIMLPITLIEPFAFFGRLMRDLLRPAAAGVVELAGRALQPAGLYLPAMPAAVHPGAVAVTVLLSVLLTAAVVLRGRLVCNTVCPVGALLRIPAARARYAVRLDSAACIACGRCVSRCPAGCIDIEEGVVASDRCILCLACLGICPTKAVRWGRRSPRNDLRTDTGPGISRRSFLGILGLGSAGLAAGCSLGGESPRAMADGRLPTVAAPPGSRGTDRFGSRCIACHLCVSRCPTAVLQPGLFAYGLEGVNQPFMDFESGFCEYECTLCSAACPTGAILPVAAEEKKRIQIGEARFIEERCIVITNGTACGACAEVCPTGAARMVPWEGLLTLPETTPEICIGCGHCENACPSLPQKAIVVTGLRHHGEALPALPPDERQSAAELLRVEKDTDGDEFPF